MNTAGGKAKIQSAEASKESMTLKKADQVSSKLMIRRVNL